MAFLFRSIMAWPTTFLFTRVPEALSFFFFCIGGPFDSFPFPLPSFSDWKICFGASSDQVDRHWLSFGELCFAHIDFLFFLVHFHSTSISSYPCFLLYVSAYNFVLFYDGYTYSCLPWRKV